MSTGSRRGDFAELDEAAERRRAAAARRVLLKLRGLLRLVARPFASHELVSSIPENFSRCRCRGGASPYASLDEALPPSFVLSTSSALSKNASRASDRPTSPPRARRLPRVNARTSPRGPSSRRGTSRSPLAHGVSPCRVGALREAALIDMLRRQVEVELSRGRDRRPRSRRSPSAGSARADSLFALGVRGTEVMRVVLHASKNFGSLSAAFERLRRLPVRSSPGDEPACSDARYPDHDGCASCSRAGRARGSQVALDLAPRPPSSSLVRLRLRGVVLLLSAASSPDRRRLVSSKRELVVGGHEAGR